MQGIKVINPIVITGGNDEFKPFANVDAKYGPYTDLATARFVLEHYLTKGLTIGVIEEGKIVEYWIKDDTNEFVKKLSDDTISYKKVASFGIIMSPDEKGIIQFMDVNGNTVLNGESFQWIEENTIELSNPENVLPNSIILYPNEIYKVTYINNNGIITAAINFQNFIADKDVYGVVKSISTVTDLKDYTPCPVEKGVVYYKTEQVEQVQADWNETNNKSKAYIKNKPKIEAMVSGIQLVDESVMEFVGDIEVTNIDIQTQTYFMYIGEKICFVRDNNYNIYYWLVPNWIYKLNDYHKPIVIHRELMSHNFGSDRGTIDCLYKYNYLYCNDDIEINKISHIDALQNGDEIILELYNNNYSNEVVYDMFNEFIDIDKRDEYSISVVNLYNNETNIVIPAGGKLIMRLLYFDDTLHITYISH